MNPAITGGCQCGHVRYAITGPLHNPHICHCRMCQKAFGNYFAALVGAARENFRWSRGKPGVFRSSSIVSRFFCSTCGTPLAFAYDRVEEHRRGDRFAGQSGHRRTGTAVWY